jgi:hypothetical protein
MKGGLSLDLAFVLRPDNIQSKIDELRAQNRLGEDDALPDAIMRERMPCQIQIAPWYLKFERRKATKFQLSKDLLSVRANLAPMVLPVTAKFLFAPIDTMTLLDKVILHEFTHLPKAGLSIDVGFDLFSQK